MTNGCFFTWSVYVGIPEHTMCSDDHGSNLVFYSSLVRFPGSALDRGNVKKILVVMSNVIVGVRPCTEARPFMLLSPIEELQLLKIL